MAKKKESLAKRKSALRETVDVVVWAVVMAFLARSFLIQAFRIPSASMEDTLLVGDFLFVNKFLYGPQIPFTDIRLPGLRAPRPGDVIVFRFPDEKDDFIKRCVAVGGQTLEIRNGVLYRDGQRVDEDYTKFIFGDRHSPAARNFGPYLVPPGQMFMMGDNRDNSSDSRVHGTVDWRKSVKGKAIFVYWSWDHKRKLPRFSRIGDLIH
jgi:signal peptidase I